MRIIPARSKVVQFVARVAAFLAAGWFCQAQTTNTSSRESSPRAPRLISPEISADRQLTFRIRATNATTVQLNAGDFQKLGDGTRMTRGTNGIWETTVGPINPGTYRYSFNVDGVTVIDPQNPATSESNENTWSLLHLPGAEYLDARDVPHGTVGEVPYWSSTLKRFRRLHVYTPPGYDSGTGRYPVLYLLHGSSDSDDAWTTIGRAGFILDNLIAAKKAKPMVVVMPAGHVGSTGFRAEPGSGFEDDFRNDILPLMEKRYRILTNRANRALAGLSMGGSQTLNIAFTQLDKFAYLGIYSSGIFNRRNTNTPAGPTWEEKNRAALENPKFKRGLKLVWFATGKDDFVLKSTQSTVELLRKHNFEVTYRETEGGHTWINWREYLNEFAPLLFR